MTIRPLTFTLFTALICMMLLGSVVTAEDAIMPGLPHSFYGTIEIADGKPVPANYAVEAIGEGILTGLPGNPLLTYEGGFGGIGAISQKLVVQGTISPGDPITFLVGDYPAQIWVVADPQGWQDNISYIPGEVTEIRLKVDAALTEQAAPADVYVYPTVTQTSSSSGSVSYGTGTGSNTGGTSSPATYVTLSPTRTTASSGESVTQIATPAVKSTSAPAKTGEQSVATTEIPAAQAIPPSYIAGGIIIVIIIAGGAWYYSRMGKKD